MIVAKAAPSRVCAALPHPCATRLHGGEKWDGGAERDRAAHLPVLPPVHTDLSTAVVPRCKTVGYLLPTDLSFELPQRGGKLIGII